MSQSPLAVPRRPQTSESTTAVDATDRMQTLLDAVAYPDCRAILDETGEAARSASELSERCDLPLSTTYRKLELLTDADLLEERTRVRRSGKHASEYVRSVERLVVAIGGEDGTELQVSRRDPPAGSAPFQ